MRLNETVVYLLKEKGLTITTMESCTGGALISKITDLEGSSEVTEGGYVTYSNKAKLDMGISPDVFEKHGVYSLEMAEAMADRCRLLKGSTFGVGITGSLNNLDITNKDSKPCTVYYAISYEKPNGLVEVKSYTLEVQPLDRPLQKDIIVREVLSSLIAIYMVLYLN